MKKGNAFHRKLEPKRQTEKFFLLMACKKDVQAKFQNSPSGL